MDKKTLIIVWAIFKAANGIMSAMAFLAWRAQGGIVEPSIEGYGYLMPADRMMIEHEARARR